MNEISIREVKKEDKEQIDLIAGWYFEEWKISKEYTSKRLKHDSNDDVIFHLLLYKEDKPVATGGLFRRVNLLNVYPEFEIFTPWVALLYTTPVSRKLGFGEILLRKIEEKSKATGFEKIYLHTFTAERLYLRNNWTPFDKVSYKDHTTVVMSKEL